MILSLTKHHGLGNDFLVLLDPSGEIEITADLAHRLCERRTGIGADGLLHLRKAGDGADLDLTVWNADGSIAETSGNGLRCAAQAAVDGGVAGSQFLIRTGGAIRSLAVDNEDIPGRRRVAVTMGVPQIDEIESPTWGQRALRVDTGNPHAVVQVEELAQFDPTEMERASREDFGAPLNLEAVRLDDDGAGVTLRVWERGVGETRACGSGAVASAAAARRWGLSAEPVRVTMPGGSVEVSFRPDGEAVLMGPAIFVGRIEVDAARIAT